MPVKGIDDGPFWVKPVLVLGATTVIALYLVWWMTNDFNERLMRMEQTIATHEAHRQQDTQQVNAFLYAICLNAANDDTQRARCAIALDGGLQEVRRK